MLRALLLPLAALCLGVSMLIGGRAAQILAIAGTALAGAAVVLGVAHI